MKTNMKLISSSLFVCLLMVSWVIADPNLQGHWKLDETSGTIASDSSGNGNNATLVNSPVWTTGMVSGGLELNGNQWGTLPETPSLDIVGNGITLAAWIYPHPGSRGSLIHKDRHYSIFRRDDGKITYADGRTWSYKNIGYYGNTPDNTWSHIAATFDGTYIRIYIDGVEVGSKFRANPIIDNHNNDVYLGRYHPTNGYAFDGLIDDLRVYDRALSASEINALYVGDSTPPSDPTNLVGTPVSATQIDLSWDASSDPESGVSSYNLYRDDVLVGQPNTNSFSDAGLTQNTQYDYVVSAINGAGLSSDNSTVEQVTTLPDTTAPEILSANIAGPFRTKVNVTWSEEIDTVTAENPANYAVNNGVTVLNATQISPTVVLLTTTEHGEYTVTANNVEDLEGNAAVNEQEDYSMLGCFI